MTPTTPPSVPKLLLSAAEAARALSICPKSLWIATIPRGSIPCVRIGARVLYAPADLQAWIDRQRTMGGPDNE